MTLNLGLRYDIYEYMNQPNLERNRTYQALQAIGSPYGALPETDKNNFSPRLGLAWDLKGDGTSVVRGSYGLYYMMQIKNTYYQRNYIEKDTVFINQVIANSAIGSGPLANFIYGVTPISSVAPTPVNPTNFPAGGNNTGYWYDPDLQGRTNPQVACGLLSRPRQRYGRLGRLHPRRAAEWLAQPEHQPAARPRQQSVDGPRSSAQRRLSARLQRPGADGRGEHRGFGESRQL